MTIDIEIVEPAWGEVGDIVQRAGEAALTFVGVSTAELEVAVRLANDDEVRQLNHEYRNKDAPTNVLSFESRVAADGWSAEMPRPVGDIILGYGVVSREAAEQGKSLESHLCHLIVHGVLHLVGYDHQDDMAADKMEELEVKILAALGIENPYAMA
ncbi:MAG: rRNA maturation RNase YbeY [Hyphomicrobiales bacterium]